MSFNQTKLDLAINQSRGIFDVFIYRSDEDTIEEIQSPGYFDESRFLQRDPDSWYGSKILCQCSDGTFIADIASDGAISLSSPSVGGLPRFEQIPDPEATVITGYWTNCVLNSDEPWNAPPSQLIAKNTHLFEQIADGKVRYIGDVPAWIVWDFYTTGDNHDSTNSINVFQRGLRNGLHVEGATRLITPRGGSFANIGGGGLWLIPVVKYDVLNIAFRNASNSNDYDVRYFTSVGTALGFTSESELLGDELFENPDIESTDGFTGSNTTPVVSGDELYCVATAAASYVDANISGLTIGRRYRVEVGARRGAQGNEQQVASSDWGTIVSESIDITTEDFYVFELIATAASGYFRIDINSTGAVGDELYISRYSVKEVL